MLFRLILIWYLSLPFVLGSTGCSPPSTSSGLSVDYFDDVAYKNRTTGYLNVIDSMTPDYTNNGVSDINFAFTGITQVSSADADSTTDYRDVYGRSTNVVKFGLRLSGYFLAPEDGTYTFTFTAADDTIAMTLGGATQDLDCCIGANELSLEGSLKANGTTAGGSTSSISKVSMIAGNYYPVKIIYYNMSPTAAGMTLQVTYPDGTTHTDDIPWYYSTADDEDLCTTTTTTNIWTGTDTEYFTVTGSDGDVTVTKEVPESTTTTTEVWTGSVPTTITIYPSNPSDPVTVDIKTPESTTTTTEVWTGSVPTTITIYPSNPSDPVTVDIKTPESTTTTTIPGTIDTTFTLTPSNPSDPVKVIVETNGKPTVVVETPEPVVTEKDVTTIILPCTCKEPSTTTTTGDDGKKTVVCNVPHSLVSTVVVTEPCTNVAGDVTVTTYTTFTVAAAVTANPTQTVASTGAEGSGSEGSDSAGSDSKAASAGNSSGASPQEISTYEAMGSKNTYTFLAVLSALLWISF
ncbi:hypothetical protein PSN45_004763 [Yamadazyma tenuis]|uniref:uncharacterized protein n=1 Tax=Candida tenuis TaxID=2315449 RepID=UPI0027A28AF5|nr:hypothetical protein PSN45_004763 [Yamadazyma tenuis]